MKRLLELLGLCALLGLMFHPRLGETCGPFFNPSVFVRPHGPDEPLAEFARGNIGVVLPEWRTAYRVVAHRYLESKPLSAAEQQSFLGHYSVEGRLQPPNPTENTASDWPSTRGKYPPQPVPAAPEEYKEPKGGFNAFPNCLNAAFATAAVTLQNRARHFGPNSPELQEWVRGQDAVFSNCEGGPNIPPELPATANSLLRADRAYQIASAHFYAGTAKEYESALKGFQTIAQDNSSPWHAIASYLMARTLIRQASVAAAENQTYDPAFLAKAEAQLEAIDQDPAQQSMHAAAKSLLSFVRIHLHPEQRKAELGKLLAAKETNTEFGQNLIDYNWLQNHGPSQGTDDLSAWLAADAKGNQAIENWRKARTVPWLVAALWQVKPSDRAFDEVMEAAAKVPPTSNAFITVAYYRARLARQSGNDKLCRQVLSVALAHDKDLPPSAAHLLRDEQIQVVKNIEGFESGLVQTPIGFEDEDGNVGACEKSGCAPQFTPLTAEILNTRIPMDVLARIAQGAPLPSRLRSGMATSAWTRAALLGQFDLATQLAAAATEVQPALKPYVERYSQAQNAEERRFAAAFAILHSPGLRPFVDGPLPRLTAFEKIDDVRDNWWCDDVGGNVTEPNYGKCGTTDGKRNYALMQLAPASGGNPALTRPVPADPPPDAVGFPAFLNAAEKQRAAAEWHDLYALGSAAHYLPGVVIDWGKKHPEDPRVAEALHLSVRAMRFSGSNELSHEAFLLLHKNYPNSEWAKKTPLWFK